MGRLSRAHAFALMLLFALCVPTLASMASFWRPTAQVAVGRELSQSLSQFAQQNGNSQTFSGRSCTRDRDCQAIDDEGTHYCDFRERLFTCRRGSRFWNAQYTIRVSGKASRYTRGWATARPFFPV
jgi:hypothetical protein